MKKLLYIIGAGTSEDFLRDENGNVLSSSVLTSALEDHNLWVKTLERIECACGSSFINIKLSVDDFWPFLEDFRNKFDEKYANSSRLVKKIDFSFEKLIAYLDFISRYIKNIRSPNISEFDPVNHIGIDKSIFLNLINNPEVEKLPIWAREVIHQRVNDFTVSADLNASLSIYFQKQLRKYESINIYTLNYDSLLSDILKEENDFIHGFDAAGGFCARNFMKSKNTIAFLHGHQNFYGVADVINMASEFNGAFTMRAKSLWGKDISIINQKVKSVSMITGIDKEKELQVDVYRHYYHRLVRDALEADELCCIGYGCGDDHVNSVIRTFLDYGRPITIVGKKKGDNSNDWFKFTNKGNIKIESKIRYYSKGAKHYFENDPG